MFNKVSIPVLGSTENMTVHICSSCGHREHLFGEGSGSRITEQFGMDLLGSLPLSMMIREQADGGEPKVVSEPESRATMIYKNMARHITAELSLKVLKMITAQSFLFLTIKPGGTFRSLPG